MKLVIPKNPMFVSCPVKELTADKLTPALHVFYYADVIPYQDRPLPDRPVAELLEEHITMFYERVNECGWSGAPRVNTPFGFGYLTQAERDKLHRLGINHFNVHPGLGPCLHTGQIAGTHTSILEVQMVATFLRDLRVELDTSDTIIDLLFAWASGTDKTIGEYHLDNFAKSFLDQLKMRRATPYGIDVTAGLHDAAEGIWFGTPNCAVQVIWNTRETFYIRCTSETYQLIKNIATFDQIGEGELKTRGHHGPITFKYVVNGALV